MVASRVHFVLQPWHVVVPRWVLASGLFLPVGLQVGCWRGDGLDFRLAGGVVRAGAAKLLLVACLF